MPVYRITLHGIAAPLLVRDESAAKAKDQILDLKALTTEEMADALAAGETIYKAGDSVLGKKAEKAETWPTERIDYETGMVQRHTGLGMYADDRPASVDEMMAEHEGDLFRVDTASGMVQRQRAGADGMDWEDIREASKDEIAAATPSPAPAKK